MVLCANDTVQGPVSWKVFDKAGLIHLYGGVGRLHNVSLNRSIAWYVSESSDRDSNGIRYSYDATSTGNAVSIRPTEINYTTSATLAPTRTIKFVYDDTDVQPSSSLYGIRIDHYGRLSNVHVIANGTLLRRLPPCLRCERCELAAAADLGHHV